MATPWETLQNRKEVLSGALSSSNTAYAPNTLPSTKDVSTATQLSSINKQIEDLRSKELQSKWYGPAAKDAPTEGEGNSDGFLMGALKNLSKPMNVGAGIVQYALGKGTKDSLVENINEAMRTGLNYGSILQQSGASRGVSAPLGFALDIALDPVNWMTGGTAALVPRIGMGLVKGGAKGAGVKGAIEAAKVGLTSSLEKKAATTMRYVPFATKSETYTGLLNKLGTKAGEGAAKYDELVGKNIYDKLGTNIWGNVLGKTAGEAGLIGRTTEKYIPKLVDTFKESSLGNNALGRALPSGEKVGESINKLFKYSPTDNAKVTAMRDKVLNTAKDNGLLLVGDGKDLVEFPITELMKPGAVITIEDATHSLADIAVKDAQDVLTLNVRDAEGIVNPALMGGVKIKVKDTLQNAIDLLGISKDDVNMKHLVNAYHVTEKGKTGVAWYDNFIDKVKATSYRDIGNFIKTKSGIGTVVPDVIEKEMVKGSEEVVRLWNSVNAVKGNVVDIAKSMSPGEWKPFEKILTGLADWTSIMKGAKTSMNVGGAVVNTVGNFFFGPMIGIPTYKSAYLKELLNARNLVNNKLSTAAFREMFSGDVNSMLDLMENNPTAFKKAFGFSVSDIEDKLSMEYQKLGSFKGVDFKELRKTLQEGISRSESAASDIENKLSLISELQDVSNPTEIATAKKIAGRYKTPTETMRDSLEKGSLRSESTTGMLDNELTNTAIDRARTYISNLVKENPQNPTYQFANLLLDRIPRMYEHVDQIQKIATVNYLTKVGLNEQELLTLGRNIPIDATDIIETGIVNGEKLYKLKPLKATLAATEAFMDYSAMPDLVKILRSAPVIGAPFLAFQYAMAVKMGKTAINNPAVFNKIGFILSEISGNRTPEEKVALETEYYKYLKSPTVVKLLGKMNTDVKNLIPIYGMNMFNPSKKNYDDSAQGKFLEALDKFPIFQDPAGQVLKDFLIQPMVLSGTSQRAQGSFGQPLLPYEYDLSGKIIEPGLGTKAFYGGRAAIESVVPGSLSYLGVIPGMMGMSPEAIEYIPSYGARNLADATQGRSSIGKMTNENAFEKTLRSLFARTGIPLLPLNTTYTSSK